MPGTRIGAIKGWATRRNLYGVSGRSGAVGHGVKGSLNHPKSHLFDVGALISAADRAHPPKRVAKA